MEVMDWGEASEPTRTGVSRVPAGDVTPNDAQAIVKSFSHPLDTVPGGNATGRPHKRRDSLLDGRDGKRSKSIDTGDGSGPTVGCGVDHRFQRWGEESRMPSSSGEPTETPCGTAVLDNCGGRRNMHGLSSLQLEGAKHKVFISHSGAQKDFAEQLCVDLERQGHLRPFFDLRQHSLPKGEDFVPLIKEAARHCHVAVMVLTEEFLCSKWPMIELAEFHGAQEAGNRRLKMLPLFYKLSVEDLGEKAIEERWMPKWTQLADADGRIVVADWIGAVRALRKANGIVFGQRGVSEVGYRTDIVKSISRLSPPDLSYGSSRKMVGYNRVCEAMCSRFVRGTSGGPSFLGVYGASGVGKTTLSKALCEQFCGEYMGRVCHVDLGEGGSARKSWDVDLNVTLRLGRVKRMLERLCGLDKGVVDRITDVDEGLTELERHMKREGEPVFLAIDNVTDENSSWDEVRDYVRVGFHPESRIMITSRSIENIWNLVPDIPFCVAMPRMNALEAGELFLRSAAPSMSILGLTPKEQRIVGLCIQQCMFDDPDQLGEGDLVGEDEGGLPCVPCVEGKSFHPMALKALGDVFERYFRNGDMLRWPGYLEERKDPLWDVWKLRDGMGGIFGLQFHSLSSREQLLFLDIAFFEEFVHENDLLSTLCDLHEETNLAMLRRLQDLERSGMIMLHYGGYDMCIIIMHEIYERFAKWYMTNHGVQWLKSAWCVFKSRGFTSDGDNVALSNLVRLRVVDLSLASTRMLASKMVQELHNLEVLVLESCNSVKELNLDGLVRLPYLDVSRMQNLERVSLCGSHSPSEGGSIFDALNDVTLCDLPSLVHGPDISWCTSLSYYYMDNCPKMMNMDGVECPHVRRMQLKSLVGHQLARLPNVKALHSLEYFRVDASSCVVRLSDVEVSRGVRLRDLRKSFLRVVEEVIMYLRTDWVVNTVESTSLCEFRISWQKFYTFHNEVTLRDLNGNSVIVREYDR